MGQSFPADVSVDGRSPQTQRSLKSDVGPREAASSSAYAVAQATLPEWSNVIAMASLIFGGCCANVFALEAIIKEAPSSGTLITFTQFTLTSLLSLKPHVDFSRGIKHLYLKPRGIPLRRWLLYTLMFLTINVLNNQAFKYRISVPLHIIIRSAGPVSTMAVGYVAGKRYRPLQVLAVVFLFLGVIQAAMADVRSKRTQTSFVQSDVAAESDSTSGSDFVIGFGIIFIAMLLSAVMGIFTDRTYAKYGRDHWSENLFYSHTLSLPFFLLYWSDLTAQSQGLLDSTSMTLSIKGLDATGMQGFFQDLLIRMPVPFIMLITNGFTQYLCIRGVSLLSAQSSSLTVTIVLNVRKLVSLLLSIWMFGNRLAPGVLLGALLVFIGAGLYALPVRKPASPQELAERKEQ